MKWPTAKSRAALRASARPALVAALVTVVLNLGGVTAECAQEVGKLLVLV